MKPFSKEGGITLIYGKEAKMGGGNIVIIERGRHIMTIVIVITKRTCEGGEGGQEKDEEEGRVVMITIFSFGRGEPSLFSLSELAKGRGPRRGRGGAGITFAAPQNKNTISSLSRPFQAPPPLLPSLFQVPRPPKTY